MRGTVRKISLPRRLVADLMHASLRIPFVSLSRPLNVRQLVEARALTAQPPGWAAIFVKAFSLVAKDEAVLRTLYAKWPSPSFYELPRSVAMVAIARVEDGQHCVLPQKVPAADALPLSEIDRLKALPHLATRLNLIDIPCQIIAGRLDPYVLLKNAEALHRNLLRSTLHVLDCGHFTWEDAAKEYGELTSAWIMDGYARPNVRLRRGDPSRSMQAFRGLRRVVWRRASCIGDGSWKSLSPTLGWMFTRTRSR